MASCSSSRTDAFDGIEPPSKRIKSAATPKLYHVFINHRGPDVKEILATKLYNAFTKLGIRAFLDSEELELGDQITSAIRSAISSSCVQIAIFSKGYVDSPWCLAELVLMLNTRAMLIPIFYDVEPSDLRYIKGQYDAAFSTYKEKGRHLDKIEQWKKALQTVSGINGYEPRKHKNDMDELCKKVVSAVQEEVKRTPQLFVAKNPVGLDEHVQDFERLCLHNGEKNNNGQIVGIYGMGGVGKTTLAKELFNRMRSKYDRSCFLYDVREASLKGELKTLQIKLLRDLFTEDDVKFNCTDEGISYIKSSLERGRLFRFFIIVDDVDHLDQLDALVVRDAFNSGSLIIVTTRDEGVLKSAKIRLRYKMNGMNPCDSSQLFCLHAFDQPNPAGGYEALADSFVKACYGLPLSLKVLGSHVCGRADKRYWKLELEKIKSILPGEISKILKISFDALDKDEKEIFMDIACFFVGKPTSMGERIWDGSLWSGEHAIETLKDKSLVEEVEEFRYYKGPWELVLRIRMHDHLRDLGRELADGCNHPRRIWHPEHLQFLGFRKVLSETNVRCLNHYNDPSGFSAAYFLGNSKYSLRTVPLWLDLLVHNCRSARIPSWIPLQNVQVLTIRGGDLGILWQRVTQVPSQLKELHLHGVSLKEFQYSLGTFKLLENLVVDHVEGIQIEGKSFSESLRKLTKLKNLKLQHIKNMSGELAFNKWRESTSYMSSISSLERIEIGGLGECSKVSICGDYCRSLKTIHLQTMDDLLEVNLSRVTTLTCLKLESCRKLKRVSGTSELEQLARLNIHLCPELKEFPGLAKLNCLEQISIKNSGKVQNIKDIEKLQGLTYLHIMDSPELVELRLASLNCLERISIENCGNLQNIRGLEELQGSKRVELIEGNEGQLHTIQSLERLPEDAISSWRAGCVVESALEPNLFENVIGAEAITEFGIDEHHPIILPQQLLVLILSGCSLLQSLPASLIYTRLQILNLSDCKSLRSLPNKMGDFRSLVSLNMEGCDVSILPKDFGVELSTLEHLNLSRCRNLRELPASFGNLIQLKFLWIAHNPQLTELPESFASLKALRYLDAGYCGLSGKLLDILFLVFRLVKPFR